MRLPAGRGDCTIGKDTQGNIYRRRSRRALRADQYSRSVHAGGPGGIVARPREFRGLRPGRPDGRRRLPGGRLP